MLFLVKEALLRQHNLFPDSKLTFTDALPDPRCLEPMKPGDCWNYMVKWFYDKNGNSCGQFWYGGCNGTNNRFETEKECREASRHGLQRGLLPVMHNCLYKRHITHPKKACIKYSISAFSTGNFY
uniref:BPTI/Kunitz inhibitor domain-containing protein n=1 Tax=Cyanoderma ruficeps TaxID=181631 RepID=A0A8C3X9V7_9PASS